MRTCKTCIYSGASKKTGRRVCACFTIHKSLLYSTEIMGNKISSGAKVIGAHYPDVSDDFVCKKHFGFEDTLRF